MDRPEQDLQRALFQHIRQRGVPGLVAWHTPNGAYLGGKRSRKGVAIAGSIMKGLGVLPGVSDIIAVYDGKVFALELKAPGGRATEAQLEFISNMERAGAFTCVAEGLDRALKTLEMWGLLRGEAA